MRRVVAGILALALIGSTCLVAQDSAPKKKSKRSVKPKGPTISQQLLQLQDQLKQQQTQIMQQQAQIQQLQTQLQAGETNVSEVKQQGQQLQTSVAQANASAEAANKATSDLNTKVADLGTNTTTISQNVQETQKKVKDLETPAAIHYKGVGITLGGWVDGTFLFRNRNENADATTNFGATPFGGTANAALTEFRGTARASRFILTAEGKAGTTKLTGYYELDFLSQAPTANQVETNSFNPRQRQLWGQAAFANGITLTAGQMWGLITTDRKGIATRAEFIPTTIEGSYVVGYSYIRQNAFRLTKNFNDKFWAAFEVANPETTFSTSFQPANIFGLNTSPNALSPNGSTLNFLAGSTNGFSTNLAPDLLAKIAVEPGWGHYELKFLGRFFRDRINGSNHTSYGGGIGAAAILPVVPKKADVILEGLVGAGIGRYGAANGPDVTIRPDGVLVPIRAVHVMAGVEVHPHPKFDLYMYGGDEYYARTNYVSPTGTAAGYGSPLVVNTGCNVEVPATPALPCGAQNRNLYHGTVGAWYRLYKGPFGIFQYGFQYEYLHRATWQGVGGEPKGIDNVGMTSIRYVLP